MAPTCDDCSEMDLYARGKCRRCYQRWYMRERRHAAKPYLKVWAAAQSGHKICRKCERELERSAFSPRARGRDGLAAWCRSCVAEGKRARRAADPDARIREREYEQRSDVAARSRRRRRATTYGISATDLEAMEMRQAGRCAVCQQERKLAMDHCHKSGKVRALLCHPCNVALGLVNDDVTRLADLIAYVERHRASVQ